MRAVVQRVSRAAVVVDDKHIAEIGPGLAVLVGIAKSDGSEAVEWMAQKVTGLRIFADDAGKMNRSVKDVDGSLLLVSNFTLCGDARTGRRPSFTEAASFEEGRVLFEGLVERVRSYGPVVKCGEYGADMLVSINNDGPVTLVLDSP